MLENIKNWLFYKEFKTDARPKGHKSSGLNNLQSVAILFDGTDENERKIVHKLKKNINTDGKKNIKSIAFINNQLPLDNIDYLGYNLKNVKWHGIPFGDKVEEFIHLKSDILIVLIKNMMPHFEYIIAHSEAKFIIGPSIVKSEKYFDVTVQTGENENTESIIKRLINAINTIAIK